MEDAGDGGENASADLWEIQSASDQLQRLSISHVCLVSPAAGKKREVRRVMQKPH